MLRIVRGFCFGLALAVALSAVGPTQAQEVTLRWKFKAGDTWHYAMTQEMQSKMKATEGIPAMNFTNTQVMDMTWKVEAVDDQGVATVTQTIDRMRMKMQTPQGVMIDYDSAAGKEPEGMAKMLAGILEAFVKKPFTVKLTARGEVKEIKLPQGLLESTNKLLAGQAGNLLSEDFMKQMGEIGVMPEKPVKPGETWTRKATAKNPIMGSMAVETTFRYDGTETHDGKPLAKIGLEMKMTPGGEKAEGNKPDAGINIVGKGSQGTMLFDNEAGHVVESKMKMQMSVSVSVAGKKIEQDIDMDQTAEMKPADAAQKETPKQ